MKASFVLLFLILASAIDFGSSLQEVIEKRNQIGYIPYNRYPGNPYQNQRFPMNYQNQRFPMNYQNQRFPVNYPRRRNPFPYNNYQPNQQGNQYSDYYDPFLQSFDQRQFSRPSPGFPSSTIPTTTTAAPFPFNLFGRK
jgi:hypothetical protein